MCAQKLSRREFLKAAGAAMAANILSACGQGDTARGSLHGKWRAAGI